MTIFDETLRLSFASSELSAYLNRRWNQRRHCSVTATWGC